MKILKSYKRRQSNCYLNEAFCSGDDFEPLLCDSRCEGKQLITQGYVTPVALFVKITSHMLQNCFNYCVHHFTVEWSCFETFKPLAGEQILDDPRYMYYEIPNLVQGNAYYVRVRAWNIKGFGPAVNSDPPYAIPSSKLFLSGVGFRFIYIC